MATRHATWKEAHIEAATLANRHKLDVAIRAVKEYGKLGYNVSFASVNDSDYARAEIVRPGAPIACSDTPYGDGNRLGADGVIYPGDPAHCDSCFMNQQVEI